MFFSGVWAIFKHLLDPITQKKIQIISGNGKKELLKIIDSKNLPQFLGGEATNNIQSNPGIWQEELINSYA